MENNAVFTYRYSAAQNKEVARIRNKYLPREESKLETLRKLDRRAQSAGTLASLCIGIVGLLIFGVGMCFGLGALSGADWLSVLFGVIGIIVMLPAYPLYYYRSRQVKTALTPEILRLSEEIIRSKIVED